jgi:endo-alpha-1,4-polygalactosaminidase (GH114 family)
MFLDDVLQYYAWSDNRHAVPPNLAARAGAPRRLADFAREMMALVVRLGTYARSEAPHARRDFAVLVNGGVYIGWDAASGKGAPTTWHPLFDTYLTAIDAIAIESVLASPDQTTTIAELQNTFAHRGVPVLTIDYLSRHPQASAKSIRDQISRQARSLGFRPYIAHDERFAELDPPLLTDARVSATVPATACSRTAPAAADRATDPQ